jgi:hypothetical protein
LQIKFVDQQSDFAEVTDLGHLPSIARKSTTGGEVFESFTADIPLGLEVINYKDPDMSRDSMFGQESLSFYTALDQSSAISNPSTIQKRDTVIVHDGKDSDTDDAELLNELATIDEPLDDLSEPENAPTPKAIRTHSLSDFQNPIVSSSESLSLANAKLVSELQAKNLLIEKLQEDLQRLQLKEDANRSAIDQLENNNEALKQDIAALVPKDCRVFDDYDYKLQALESKVFEERGIRDQLIAQNNQLAEKAVSLQAAIQKLEIQYEQEFQLFEERKENEEHLLKNITKLEMRLKEALQDLEDKDKENGHLQMIVKNQDKLLSDLSEKVCSSEAVSEKLKTKKEQLLGKQKENERLEQSIRDLSRSLVLVTSQKEQLESDKVYLKERIEDLERKEDNLLAKCSELEAALESGQGETDSIEKLLKEHLERHGKSLRVLSSSFEDLNKDLDDKNRRVEKAITRLIALEQASEDKLTGLHDKIKQKDSEKFSLLGENEKLISEVQALKEELRDASGLSLRVKDLEEALKETKDLLRDREDAIESLLKDLKESEAIRTEEKQKHAEAIQKLENAAKEEGATVEKLKEDCVRQEKEAEQLRVMLLDRDQQLGELRNETRDTKALAEETVALLHSTLNSVNGDTGTHARPVSPSIASEPDLLPVTGCLSELRRSPGRPERHRPKSFLNGPSLHFETIQEHDPKASLHSYMLREPPSQGQSLSKSLCFSRTLSLKGLDLQPRREVKSVDVELLSPKVALILLRRSADFK